MPSLAAASRHERYRVWVNTLSTSCLRKQPVENSAPTSSTCQLGHSESQTFSEKCPHCVHRYTDRASAFGVGGEHLRALQVGAATSGHRQWLAARTMCIRPHQHGHSRAVGSQCRAREENRTPDLFITRSSAFNAVLIGMNPAVPRKRHERCARSYLLRLRAALVHTEIPAATPPVDRRPFSETPTGNRRCPPA